MSTTARDLLVDTTDGLEGLILDGKSCISRKGFRTLRRRGLELVADNMRYYPMSPAEKLLPRKCFIIETLSDKLKPEAGRSTLDTDSR